MATREFEARLLDRCAAVARGKGVAAEDQVDANVFMLASMVIASRHAPESKALKAAADAYFATSPGDRVNPEDVVRRGWVDGLPRLRDMLSARLTQRL